MTTESRRVVPSTSGSDSEPFADWLLRIRHGDNPETRAQIISSLLPVRDQIMANAGIKAGDSVLDVGCGDGLLGFEALERVGSAGRVTFSDPSAELLEQCRSIAATTSGAGQCDFRQTGLPDLVGVPDESVDAVLTRSVIMYVAAKDESFAAMHRVLRPGGRIAVYEPISRILLSEPPEECYGYDVSGCIDAATKVKQFYVGGPPEANPLVNFDERDLLRGAERAGFAELTLDLHVQARVTTPNPVRDWETFLRMSPNPTAPALGDAFAAVLGEAERKLVERCIRPQLDSGTLRMRYAVAFLSGAKPA